MAFPLSRRAAQIGALACLLAAPAFAQGELNIITQRPSSADQPPFAGFARQTGIKVNILPNQGNAAIAALSATPRGPGDIFLPTDVAGFVGFERLMAPYTSPATETVPAHLRHPQGLWTGVTARARVLYVAKDRADAPRGFADLADPRFRGQVCVGPANVAYNLSMIGRMVAHLGEAGALSWAKGVVANLSPNSRPVSDSQQIAAVADGRCGVAIGNHYYYLRMSGADAPAEQRATTGKVRLVWPDQGPEGIGAMINVTAVALLQGAPNRDNAVRFIEYLLTPQGQQEVSGGIFFPTVPGNAVPAAPAALDAPRWDSTPLAAVGANRAAAERIGKESGWPLLQR